MVVRREIFTGRIKGTSVFGREGIFYGVPAQGMAYPHSYEGLAWRYRRPGRYEVEAKAN